MTPATQCIASVINCYTLLQCVSVLHCYSMLQLQELQALKALELREHLLREMQKAQARAAHREA